MPLASTSPPPAWRSRISTATASRRPASATIPFATGRFDLVTSFDVFQCLPDEVERSAIREMSRVLKPGGWMLLHVAALEMLHGRHSVLSQEVRRYTPSRLRSIVGGRRLSRRAADVRPRQPAADSVAGAGVASAVGRRSERFRRARPRSRVPSPPVNAALTCAGVARGALRCVPSTCRSAAR